MTIESIDAFHNILTKYTKSKNLKTDMLILESEKVVKYAFKLGFYFKELVATESFFNENKHFLDNCENAYIIDKQTQSKIIGYKTHGGVFGLIEPPQTKDISSNRVLWLDGLTSPENVGSISRSAAAFGFSDILYSRNGASPFLKRCIRVSTGHVLGLNIIKVVDQNKMIQTLKSKNYKIISVHNSNISNSLESLNHRDKLCLIIGSEGHGIDETLVSHSDEHIKISTSPSVEHLNASNAASIIMHYFSNINIL